MTDATSAPEPVRDAEADADAEHVARHLHARDPSADTFGIELVRASATGAVVRMPVRREHCNGFEILHGGMTFLLADSAMAFASNAGGEVALASSATVDWLAPVHPGDVLTATATRSWSGGRSALWDVAITNDRGDTVAVMRGRTRRVGGSVLDPAPLARQANSEPR